MSVELRTRALTMLAAVLVVVGTAGAADAGWVTFQNDTDRVLVVQETVTVNGQARRCKPVRLLPGERFRELHLSPSLTVEVFDGQAPVKPLYTGNLTIEHARQTFSVETTGSGVVVTPAPGR